MSRKSDLLELRKSIQEFIHAAIFRGLQTTKENFNYAIHDLGTVNMLLKKCKDEE